MVSNQATADSCHIREKIWLSPLREARDHIRRAISLPNLFKPVSYGHRASGGTRRHIAVCEGVA